MPLASLCYPSYHHAGRGCIMKATVSFAIPSLTLYPSEDDISPLYGSPFVGSVFLGLPSQCMGLYACLIVWPVPGAPSSPIQVSESVSPLRSLKTISV